MVVELHVREELEPAGRGSREELVLVVAEVEVAHLVGEVEGQEGWLQVHRVDHCLVDGRLAQMRRCMGVREVDEGQLDSQKTMGMWMAKKMK